MANTGLKVSINIKGENYIVVHVGGWSYCFSYGVEVAKWNLASEQKYIRKGDFYHTNAQGVHVKKFFGGSDNMLNLKTYSQQDKFQPEDVQITLEAVKDFEFHYYCVTCGEENKFNAGKCEKCGSQSFRTVKKEVIL